MTLRSFMNRWRPTALLAVVLLAAGLTSCGRVTVQQVDEALGAGCFVLAPPGPDTTGWSAWIDRHMPSARRIDAAEAGPALALALESDAVLVVSGPFPAEHPAHDAIASYRQQGGRLLALGLEDATGSTFTFTSGVIRVGHDVTPRQIRSRLMRSPYVESCGVIAGESRSIPVARALNSNGEPMGCIAIVTLRAGTRGHHPVGGRIHMNAEANTDETLVPLVETVIETMSRRVYLFNFGPDRYSARSREGVTARAEWLNRDPRDLSPVRLIVEWVNARGIQIRRIVTPPLDPLRTPEPINLGLAPDLNAGAETYTLRFSIRDRNDQQTLDSYSVPFKVFSAEPRPGPADYVTTSGNLLMHRRRPLFMLGVSYWPRLAVAVAERGEHWLDTARFHPAIVAADLDLMIAAGINSIALEYTSLEQAPQVRYVLDELRNRGMWACLYMPALHPLELREDDAVRMLDAIALEQWPEVFALEVARGLGVKPRHEMRRLDPDWTEWINEHFSSVAEAEQRLGISLWRERNQLAGPRDADLAKGPHRDRAVALYYMFLRDYAARRMGHVRRMLEERGSHALLTARTVYGWPRHPRPDIVDFLDLSTGAHHLDFLFPDAWSIHPLRNLHNDGFAAAAYANGMGLGKPVLWSEYGHHAGAVPGPQSLQRQKEVYKHFLDFFVGQDAGGAFAWWYPPGVVAQQQDDWGIVHPHGAWRPVEEAIRNTKHRLRQWRPVARSPVRQAVPFIYSARHWRDIQEGHGGLFAKAAPANVNEWTLPGIGIDSSRVLRPGGAGWSELDAFILLNGEWGAIRVDGNRKDRRPGDNLRVYQGQQLDMELINSGTVNWIRAATRTPGSVWIRISQPGQADVWLAAAGQKHGERQMVSWVPRETGLWEVQPFLIDYGKFGERLLVEVTAPPRVL